jgi:hypothetical protein
MYARLKVGEQIAALAGKKHMLEVKSMNMKLAPYYVFEYYMELLDEGSLDIKQFTGKVMVNAATKAMREMPKELEITENFNEPHIKLSFSFSKYDAFTPDEQPAEDSKNLDAINIVDDDLPF